MKKDKLYHSLITFLAIMLATVGIAGPAAAKNNRASANGHGNLVMDGAIRTFSFHARESKGGDVLGSFELKNRQLGVRAHAHLDCLRVNGNEAFISGVLTQVDGIEGNFIGDEVWFHVKDNGEGRGDPPDQISIGYCQLKSNWADFLPRTSNLNAEQSMSYEFVLWQNFGQIHLT